MAKDLNVDPKDKDLRLADSPNPNPPQSTATNAPAEQQPPGRLVTGANPLPQPPAGDPPMTIERLRSYRDDPKPDTERFARQLLTRCGPLVFDGKQYRLHDDGLRAVPVEVLGAERMAHLDVDKFKIERA